MPDTADTTKGLGWGHWLGLGCGVLVAIVAMVVIGLVNARRPRPAASLKVTPVVAAVPPDGQELTSVEAQPGRDPFARPGGVTEPPADGGQEPATDGGETSEPVPPQPVMPAPDMTVDEPPVDEPPDDMPEPSTGPNRRRNNPPEDDGGEDGGGDGSEPASRPAKPKMPTVAELRPHDPTEPPAWALPPQVAEGGLELVAIIAGKSGQAIFKQDGKYLRKRVGETIEGLSIERVDSSGVYLKDGDHRYLMRMPAKITPGGTRNSVVASRPAAGEAVEPSQPDPTPATTPEPTMAPAPSSPAAGAGDGTGRAPQGQRPSGQQRPGTGQRPGGGSGGFPTWQGGGGTGGRPGGGGWNRPGGGDGQGGAGGSGGGSGRRRPPDDEE